MTFASKISKIALAAALSFVAAGASAMTLHNCTDGHLKFVLQDKTGNVTQGTSVRAQRSGQLHATKSFGPYRIILPELGPGAHFSNRDGDGTYSFLRTGGGNIAIRNGNVCEQHASKGRDTGGKGGEICFDNNFGLKVCLRP